MIKVHPLKSNGKEQSERNLIHDFISYLLAAEV